MDAFILQCLGTFKAEFVISSKLSAFLSEHFSLWFVPSEQQDLYNNTQKQAKIYYSTAKWYFTNSEECLILYNKLITNTNWYTSLTRQTTIITKNKTAVLDLLYRHRSCKICSVMKNENGLRYVRGLHWK